MTRDEARCLEALEMHVDQWAAELHVARQLADVVPSLDESGQDLDAVRVRQRGEHPNEVLSLRPRLVRHLSETTDR